MSPGVQVTAGKEECRLVSPRLLSRIGKMTLFPWSSHLSMVLEILGAGFAGPIVLGLRQGRILTGRSCAAPSWQSGSREHGFKSHALGE